MKLVYWYILCSFPTIVFLGVTIFVPSSSPASVSESALIASYLFILPASILSIICFFANIIFLKWKPGFIENKSNAIQGAIISLFPLFILWVMS